MSESQIGVPEWDLTTWIDLTPGERERERERNRDRTTGRQIGADRQTDTQMNTHSDSQTDTHAGWVRDIESHWETGLRENRRGGEGGAVCNRE